MSAKRFTFEGCGFADQLFKHDGKETTRVEHGDRFVSEADYAQLKRALEDAVHYTKVINDPPEETIREWEDLIQ